MTKNIRTFIAMALLILALALTSSAAMAQSYSGSYPVTVSQTQHGNFAACITLTDNGSLHFMHSGPATLVGSGVTLSGTFQLIGGLLTVTIQEPGGTGQNAGAVFIGRASSGQIGKGVYDQVFGGEEFDSGVLVFGAKGGC